MNSSSNISNFPEENEIKINQIKLSLEKLKNLQRIILRKKIIYQKELLINTKNEKSLNSQFDSLEKNNEDLKINIEKIKENIKQLNEKNIDLKNQANKLDEKILSLETENSQTFSEVKFKLI